MYLSVKITFMVSLSRWPSHVSAYENPKGKVSISEMGGSHHFRLQPTKHRNDLFSFMPTFEALSSCQWTIFHHNQPYQLVSQIRGPSHGIRFHEGRPLESSAFKPSLNKGMLHPVSLRKGRSVWLSCLMITFSQGAFNFVSPPTGEGKLCGNHPLWPGANI